MAFRPVGNWGQASIVFLCSGSIPHNYLAKNKKNNNHLWILLAVNILVYYYKAFSFVDYKHFL